MALNCKQSASGYEICDFQRLAALDSSLVEMIKGVSLKVCVKDGLVLWIIPIRESSQSDTSSVGHGDAV